MPGLTPTDVLHAWEAANGKTTVEQALAILAIAYPKLGRAELATLSVGQRDGLLLSLCEQTFGPALEVYAECPRCEERLELHLQTSDVRATSALPPTSSELKFSRGVWDVSFRLPNSLDQLAISDFTDADQARNCLIERCVLEAQRDNCVISSRDLTEDIKIALAEAMNAADPQAEILLALQCPACEQRWQAVLEIADFVWSEIRSEAKRLLLEVHRLARAYGWREPDVLALSPARRRAYLDLVEG